MDDNAVIKKKQKQYDQSYDQYSDHLQDRVNTNLVSPHWYKNMSIIKDKIILDLGRAEGTDFLFLFQLSPSKLIGADISSEMLKIAARKLKSFKIFRSLKGNFSDDNF